MGNGNMNMYRYPWRTALVVGLALIACVIGTSMQAARIKDVVSIAGERGNPLHGIGLVVGLNGTGDSSLPSAQMLSSLLKRWNGVAITPNSLASGSIALVYVTADLPPYAIPGTEIDITVSTMGDAKSLQGGQLMPTELLGLDGEVYAVTKAAAVSTASWTAEGKTGSNVTKNHPTSGRIPNGAYVERAEIADVFETIGGQRYVTLELRNHDTTTAERIRRAIEQVYPGTVFVENAGTVRVRVPHTIGRENEVAFLAQITSLEVEVDMPAVVVINEKTGTIVVGGNVTISETAVAQGNLVVKIKEQQFVSQPIAPFTPGATTAVVPDSGVTVQEQEGHLIRVPQVVTVADLVDALNAIGATPRDLIAIFNALKVAGALQADIRMM